MFLSITDSVMNSHIYYIVVWWRVNISAEVSLGWNRCLNDLNVLLKCHIYYLFVSNLIHQFNECVKCMFLSITDSVMNSHFL